MTKNHLTLEEHKALGRELKAMRDRLVTIAVQVGNAYPATSKAYTKASAAQSVIDDLRSALDDLLFNDYATQSDDLKGIYYPINGC